MHRIFYVRAYAHIPLEGPDLVSRIAALWREYPGEIAFECPSRKLYFVGRQDYTGCNFTVEVDADFGAIICCPLETLGQRIAAISLSTGNTNLLEDYAMKSSVHLYRVKKVRYQGNYSFSDNLFKA